MDRIIEVKVGGNYISKDNKNAGVTGEANVTMLRITFDEGWDSYAKTVTFFDAHGKNPVKRIQGVDLIEDIAKDTRTYITPIPKEPLAIAGEMTFVIDGYLDGKRQRSISAKLVVKDSPDTDNAEAPTDPTPTQAEQLQEQIDIIKSTIQEASISRDEAVVSAESARESAETATTYSSKALESAMNAERYATKAEEAVGKTSYIGENGNWYAWDSAIGAFYDTGVKAQAGSTVYCGDNPPDEADVWIDPNGDGDIIDQTYNPESENAQSGKAVAQALSAAVGDLENVNEGYFPANVVEYVNEVERNIGGVAEQVGYVTRDLETATKVLEQHEVDIYNINQTIETKANEIDLYNTAQALYDLRDNVIPTKADKTYVDAQLSGIAETIPTKVSQLENDEGYLTEHQDISDKADITYVNAELAKKQNKELQWTAMYDEVLAEDRGSNVEANKLYALDLNFPARQNISCGNPNPTICVFPKYAASLVGLKILIIVPTDKAFGGGNLIVNNQVYEWVQNYQLSTYSANTLRPKIVDAQWEIKHGVSEAKCLVRTGASLTATTTNQCFKEGLFIAEYFNFLQYRGSLPAGTRIRVWGLFN